MNCSVYKGDKFALMIPLLFSSLLFSSHDNYNSTLFYSITGSSMFSTTKSFTACLPSAPENRNTVFPVGPARMAAWLCMCLKGFLLCLEGTHHVMLTVSRIWHEKARLSLTLSFV